jgi:stage II sporulation protein D
VIRPSHVVAALLAGAALAGAASSAGAQRPTDETRVFTFTGRGWGHGIGLSQYGARGRALAGWSAGRILRHYYRGASLTTRAGRSVKILLSSGRRSAAVSSPRAWRAVGARTNGRRVAPLRAGVVHRLRVLADGRLAIERGSRRVAVFTGEVLLQARGRGGALAWGPRRPAADRRYRGALRAVPGGGGFDLVNVVGLEDYLKGVVPREMPATWGDDAFAALVSQAVAARSYALATMTPTATYDVFDDDRSQVYGGLAAEDPRTSRAVDATRGRVLTYDGEVIVAFFFSTSGGRTEDVQNVFEGSAPRPYLVSVPDPFDRLSPYHSWPDPPSFTAASLGRALGVGGPVDEIAVLRRGVSPRVREARVTTRSGRQAILSGTEIRSALGLRDTWFTVTDRVVPAAEAARLVGG